MYFSVDEIKKILCADCNGGRDIEPDQFCGECDWDCAVEVLKKADIAISQTACCAVPYYVTSSHTDDVFICGKCGATIITQKKNAAPHSPEFCSECGTKLKPHPATARRPQDANTLDDIERLITKSIEKIEKDNAE